jgi:uncharacterized protein YutE (UPF0331/DUF86 family)
MNPEERLNQVAARYRNLGFKVVIRPGPDDLPLFAKDFNVEIVATSDKGNILASVKASPSELEADPNVSRYAEVTEKQRGWRFDVLVLGPDQQAPAERVVPKDLDEDTIRRQLDAVEQIVRMDVSEVSLRKTLTELSLTAAWATLEAAMRRRLHADGLQAGWGTSPRTLLNQLYSSGAISTGVLRELEAMSTLRNAIVHGFSPPVIVDKNVVLKLIRIAQQLLLESQVPRQTA